MFLMFLLIVGASAEHRGADSCPLGTTQLLTDPIGNISSPGRYPDFYSNNEHCEWNIRAPEGYTLKVTFKGVELSATGDPRRLNYVVMYDKRKGDDNLLYRWTGKTTMHRPARPDPIITYTNQVFIMFDVFGEEDNVNLEGFYLDYRFLPAGTPHPGECVDYGPIRNGRIFPPHGPYRIQDTLRLECASGTDSSSPVGDLLQCEQKEDNSFPRWKLEAGKLPSDMACKARCRSIDESSAYGALRSPGWPDPDHEEPNGNCQWIINPKPGYGLRLYVNSTDFRTDEEYIEVNGRNLDCQLNQNLPYPDGRTLEASPQQDSGRVTVAYYGRLIRGSSVEIFFSSGYCSDPKNIHRGSREDFSSAPTAEQDGKVFLPGDHVTYSCDPGYELVGPAILTCTQGTAYKYQWDNHRPYCRKASWPPCDAPGPVPENGAELSPEGYDVGSTVTFTCNTGYYVRGSQARTCGPGPGGTLVWSGMQPTCVSTPCKVVPAAPAHGHVTAMELSDPRRYVAVYECDPGYVMTSGSPVRTCRDDGTWDGEPPVCGGHGTTPLPTPAIPTTASGTTVTHTTSGPTTTGHPSTVPLTSSGTTETTSLATSKQTTTSETTQNPTTQSTTIARTTEPDASTLGKITKTIPTEAWTGTTASNTPTATPTSNATKGPPGKLRQTVNTGAAIGGSVSAVALVAAVVGSVYCYRRRLAKEGEMSDWHWLRMDSSQPYRATTQPEMGHVEEPFSLDGELPMEDITSLVISDAPWGHNPAFQDD
ncbi:seizure protein 6-like [Branchiostoma floridae x Branchiostoma belcheri]